MCGCVDGSTDLWTGECMGVCMYGWIDGWMGECLDGWVGGCVDSGWMDR